MLRLMVVAIAAATLSACASLPVGASAEWFESFDAGGTAPMEAAAADWRPRSIRASAIGLDRRPFDASIWRQPDRRPLFATAVDRRFRHPRRRRGSGNFLSFQCYVRRRRLRMLC